MHLRAGCLALATLTTLAACSSGSRGIVSSPTASQPPAAGSATLVPIGVPASRPPAPDLAAFERSGPTGSLLPAERRWGRNGRIIPAPHGTPTPVSQAVAAKTASKWARYAGKTVHVELGYFTDDSYVGVGPGGKLSADAKHRIVVNRLIWLFSYPDAPVVSDGPQPLAAGLHEPLFVPVDATTGRVISAFQAGDEERASAAPPD
jgi:hypothetical protein